MIVIMKFMFQEIHFLNFLNENFDGGKFFKKKKCKKFLFLELKINWENFYLNTFKTYKKKFKNNLIKN